LKDTYKHKGLRKRLVEELLAKGIDDDNVLRAIYHIPRHFFFASNFIDFAYEDKAYPIGDGQTISQPYTVAKQTSLLQLSPKNKVLEIGTGSGYQAAVLAYLEVELFSVERKKSLIPKARKVLHDCNLSASIHYSDGTLGLPEEAPFDRIIVTAGAPQIPQALVDQLAIGGIMVIPVGAEDQQRMIRVRKTGQDAVEEEDHGPFRFVPLIGDHGW